MHKLRSNLPDMECRVGGSAYRWSLARRRATSGRIPRNWQADEHIEQTPSYLQTWPRAGRDRADVTHLPITTACAVVANDQSLKLLKLEILRELPRADAAERPRVEQQVIDVAEVSFFKFTELRQVLGWMESRASVPETSFGGNKLAANTKLAHDVGAVKPRALPDGHEALLLEEVQQTFDQELLLHAYLQAALEFEFDTNTAQYFLEVLLEYDRKCKKLKCAREKSQFEHALVREQPTNDQADRDGDSSIDAASDRRDTQDDELVQRRVANPTDNEQLVA